MSERLRREADSGLCKGWMLLPVAERNAIFADLCIRSRQADSLHYAVDWGRTPVPRACILRWVGTLSGRSAVNGAWALVLPMLLNLEGRKLIPAGWCEDEGGWLYGIVELAMRGPKAFDPSRNVPFAFFLTRRVIGNCSSRRRRERKQEREFTALHLGEDAGERLAGNGRHNPKAVAWVEFGSDPEGTIAEEDRVSRHLLSRLGRDLPDSLLRDRVESAARGEETGFSEDDLREIRRVMFSAR